MQRTEALSTLLPELPNVPVAMKISGIETDTRRLHPGMLFVGLKTERDTAGQFLAQAWQAGAVAALLEGESALQYTAASGQPVWQIPELRNRLGQALRRWHRWDENPAPLLIGVTGTNGKSSVTRLIAELAPEPAALIGTLGFGPVHDLTIHSNTTPEPVRLWDTLARLRDQGARIIALEVSSHALALERVAAVPFSVAVFTNLSRDHLDFHGDMAQYGAAKARLFQTPTLRLAVLNGDDPFAAVIAAKMAPTVKVLRFGQGSCDYQVHQVHLGASGTLVDLQTPQGIRHLRSPLIGLSNVENLLAALAVAEGLGWPINDSTIAALDLPEGRYQRLPALPNKAQVIIDYAHTPDALKKILEDLRAVAKARIIVVFGCGGIRDRGKRPAMGKIAEAFADHVILTDDNPRSEAPQEIVRDILAGMQHPEHAEVIHDRATAITQAIRTANPGDWVLIAGKGHENTQESMGQRIPFKDQEVAAKVLQQ